MEARGAAAVAVGEEAEERKASLVSLGAEQLAEALIEAEGECLDTLHDYEERDNELIQTESQLRGAKNQLIQAQSELRKCYEKIRRLQEMNRRLQHSRETTSRGLARMVGTI